MPRRSREMPYAILPTGVRVRVIGTADLSVRGRDLVFATPFFTVVFVLVQRESVVARAFVRTWRVLALVLATTIVDGTLVHVYMNKKKKKQLKNDVIDYDLNHLFTIPVKLNIMSKSFYLFNSITGKAQKIKILIT